MISRRNFLKGAFTAALTYHLAGNKAFASIQKERSLNLYNMHTDESLDITYCVSGKYDYDALDKINYFLRCHYTDEVKPIDTDVLDLLSDIITRIGSKDEVRIISGYRSREYNNRLIESGRGVVKNSMHLQGRAIDFAVDGVGSKTLSKIARSFFVGGVGTYPEFIHIDTGPVRYW